MDKEEIVNERMVTSFPVCMSAIISELEAAGKYAAVHTYSCTLRSFTEFSGDTSGLLPVCELFYSRSSESLSGVAFEQVIELEQHFHLYAHLACGIQPYLSVGSSGYIPGLFNDVYTKVESRTKRSLTQKQMRLLLESDIGLLPEDTGRSLAYFLLMFLFRGMPFIDLAHLRKRDVQGNVIVYCRHKTGRQNDSPHSQGGFTVDEEVFRQASGFSFTNSLFWIVVWVTGWHFTVAIWMPCAALTVVW